MTKNGSIVAELLMTLSEHEQIAVTVELRSLFLLLLRCKFLSLSGEGQIIESKKNIQ